MKIDGIKNFLEDNKVYELDIANLVKLYSYVTNHQDNVVEKYKLVLYDYDEILNIIYEEFIKKSDLENEEEMGRAIIETLIDPKVSAGDKNLLYSIINKKDNHDNKNLR